MLSRDQEVLTTILESGAVPYLVDMLIAEHAVMQNEAVLALTLLASTRLTDAEKNLLEAKIGDKLTTLLNGFGPSLACEMVLNILSLVDQLAKSGKIYGLTFEEKSHVNNIQVHSPYLKEKTILHH
jgi:hypothetical protein